MANPLQYSCLENPMDRGAGVAGGGGVTVRGITKSQKWLSTHNMHFFFFFCHMTGRNFSFLLLTRELNGSSESYPLDHLWDKSRKSLGTFLLRDGSNHLCESLGLLPFGSLFSPGVRFRFRSLSLPTGLLTSLIAVFQMTSFWFNWFFLLISSIQFHWFLL